MRLMLMLFAALTLPVYAQAPPQTWAANVPSLAGQNFESEQAALSAVHGVGGKYIYAEAPQRSSLPVETTSVSEETRIYDAIPRGPDIGGWDDYNLQSANGHFTTEELALAAVVDNFRSMNPSCPEPSVTGDGNWYAWKTWGNGAVVSEETRFFNVSYALDAEGCATQYTFRFQGWRTRPVSCPAFLAWNGGEAACVLKDVARLTTTSLMCIASDLKGNPCSLGSGAKIQRETDFSLPWISFERTYVSSASPLGGFAHGWTHSLNIRASINSSSGASLLLPNGFTLPFKLVGSSMYEAVDGSSTILRRSGGMWRAEFANRTMYFLANGSVSKIDNLDGNILTFNYDSVGLVSTVVNSSGRRIEFLYDQVGNPSSVAPVGIASDGVLLVSYQYDGDGKLISASYPNGATKNYHYDDLSFATYLTGVTDENSNRFSIFAYDDSGHAILTEHAGGVDRNTFVYAADGSTVHTDPNGLEHVVRFTGDAGFRRIISTSGVDGEDLVTYGTRAADFRRRPTQLTDRRGGVTQHVYDQPYDSTLARYVRRTTTTHAAGTTVSSVSQSLKDFLTGRLLQENGPGRQAIYVRNSRGQPSSIIARDLVTNANRTTTRTYDPDGRLLTLDGPRTDLSDLTTYTYYPSDDATCASAPSTCPHRKGDLHTVTNALGHVTQYLRYDGAGRLLESVDANGVSTTLTYHPRGWLTSRTVGGLSTSISYDAVGQVIRSTQADGSYTAFTYDGAHRLTGIADNLGNRIDYSLDAAGNRTAEQTKDSAGTLKRSLSRVYDQLGRLRQSIDANGASTQQTYDANGNADISTDALSRNADQDYDPLNRLKKSLRDVAGVAANTAYAYDAQDNLTEVTDPKGLKTQYTYNGLNDLLQLTSPDTGSTSYTYDSAGNRLTQTDARGVQSSYSYDALNRLTVISYADTALNVYFDYDAQGCASAGCAGSACAPGEQAAIGRLSGFSDASGDTQLCYDPLGRLTRKQQTTGSTVLSTTYAYASNGHLAQMTTPGGMQLTYQYDSAGRFSGIDSQLPSESVASPVIADVQYLPFGPITQLTYGNGRVQTRSYDGNYAIAQVTSTGIDGLDIGYSVDAVGNITQIASGSAGNQLSYDGIDRLAQVKQLNGTLIEAFSYDATGNRTTRTDSAGSTPYSYAANSHRLSAVGSTARSTDAAGNTTAIGSTTLSYDARNRLSAATVAGQTTAYQYNARGERVNKTGSSSTVFVYDEAGHLLGEYASDGSVKAEYIWLGDLPIAIRNADDRIVYIETDHLGTPRTVIDPTRDLAIWQWPLLGNAFGQAAPLTDPDGDGTAFTMNLRFPGQYFDAETGLHYNYFRDYDPGTGRYVASDPIGLGGGVGTYGYVANNPGRYADPSGLCPWCLAIPFVCAGGGCEAAAAALGLAAYMQSPAGRSAARQAADALSKDSDQCEDDNDKACERLNQIDTSTCNAITRSRGPRAGAVCHASASQRYAECLRGGLGAVRTPLNTWNN